MYLGIDLGTSSIKIVLLNEDQQVVAQVSSGLTLSHPQPLWSEQNPLDWWRVCCDTIAQLQQNHRTELKQTKAIGLSGQMHGATLLGSKGQILRPAILWNDGRSAAQCQQLETQVADAITITGNRIMPGFTAPKLLWVAQHE